jgi:uncharacterized protein (UPF0333 family)
MKIQKTKKSQARLTYGIIVGIILISIFGLYFISSELLEESCDQPDCELANQNVTIWNITKTGAEQELEIEYELKNETTTEFCVKIKDKTNYVNNVSGNISEIPIVKLNLTEDFNIDINNFDDLIVLPLRLLKVQMILGKILQLL